MAAPFDAALDRADEAVEPSVVNATMDETAFTSFYHRTARALRAYLYRLTGDAPSADDALQEAYCRLLRAKVPGGGEGALRAYLFRVATNLVVDEWRRTKRQRTEAREVPDRSAPDSPPELRVDVERALGRLRPRERALLWLAYVEESSHRDIAATLGVKEGSVKVLLHRARRKLVALLDRLEYGRR